MARLRLAGGTIRSPRRQTSSSASEFDRKQAQSYYGLNTLMAYRSRLAQEQHSLFRPNVRLDPSQVHDLRRVTLPSPMNPGGTPSSWNQPGYQPPYPRFDLLTWLNARAR